MNYQVSEDTAREALAALEAAHESAPDRILVQLSFEDDEPPQSIEAECRHGYGCGGNLPECSCGIAKAWRELAKLLGER